MRKRDVNERFDEKVDRSNPEGCWEWTGALSTNGYGKFKVRSHVQMRSHRFAFERAFGSLSSGLVVCHRCDNPKCVRPEHLFAGTISDNTRDMLNKGRRPKRVVLPKSHCKNGHEMTEKNTRVATQRGGAIHRSCRECHRLVEIARRAKQRAA